MPVRFQSLLAYIHFVDCGFLFDLGRCVPIWGLLWICTGEDGDMTERLKTIPRALVFRNGLTCFGLNKATNLSVKLHEFELIQAFI